MYLFNSIFLIIAIILDNIFGTAIEDVGYGLFYLLYSIAVFLPGLAVSVRRLHDVGKSGWMILISFVPLIGGIWLFILMVTESDPGQNVYGLNPNDGDSADSVVQPAKSSLADKESSTGDILTMIVLIWLFTYRLFWIIMPKLISDFYSAEWFEVVNRVFNLIWAFVPLTLAFTIKNKSRQIVLVILGGIYLLYGLYEMIKHFLR